MTNRPLLHIAALSLSIVGLYAGPARAADEPPKLDIESTCTSAERVQQSISENANREACLTSERGAHDDLKKRWGDFPASAKTQCSNQFRAGGSPSYVELVTCLELASGVVPNQSGGDAGSTVGGGAGRTQGRTLGSTLTRDPSPAQRTNPLDVLENK